MVCSMWLWHFLVIPTFFILLCLLMANYWKFHRTSHMSPRKTWNNNQLTPAWIPGRIVQSVTCLATDACVSADPGFASSIPARPILSWRLIMKYFLWSFSSFPLNHSRRVVVSYKQKYEHGVLVNCLFKLAQEKCVVRWTDRSAMTLAVDLGRKASKYTCLDTSDHIHALSSLWYNVINLLVP